jgi:hypothetical protein
MLMIGRVTLPKKPYLLVILSSDAKVIGEEAACRWQQNSRFLARQYRASE